MARLHLKVEYPLFDTDDGRVVVMPDGRAMRVDFDHIHEMAESGGLAALPEEARLFVRYLCGPVEDD